MNSDIHPVHKDPVQILLVEDNKIDARLTCHAFQKMQDWPSTVRVLDDGEKAVNFFRQPGSFARPDLIILDLNLPKYDGIEVLQVIRSSSYLHDLPVFIFSSSPADLAQERARKARLRADSYFEKPYEVGSFYSIAARMRDTYQDFRPSRHGAGA